MVEVLSAFVREHADPVTRLRTIRRWAAAAALAGEPLPADVQATLTVLGRLPPLPNTPRADLASADLSDADLVAANLSDASLAAANLSGANLSGANLATAMFLDPAQLTIAEGDEDTRLPDGWTRPASWTRPPAPPADPADPGPPPR